MFLNTCEYIVAAWVFEYMDVVERQASTVQYRTYAAESW
jgi:hypothetical protein